MSVTTAVDLVESLIEGPIPVREAAPATAAPGRGRLRVFGPDAPESGWFYVGPDPLGDFIRYKRGKDAVIRGPEDEERYIDFFTRNGYIFVFRDGPGFQIRSKVNLHIPQDGIKAMEETMGLTQESVIDYNGQKQPASEIIYGQPNRANQKAAQAQAQNAQGSTGQPQLLKATFGGLYGPQGHFESGKDVNIAAMKKLLADGYAFVIQYGNGGFNVVTPKGYKFSPQEIKQLEAKMGITRKTPVQWFVNSVSANAMTASTAQVAIYGEQPTRQTPPGLATPPPTF